VFQNGWLKQDNVKDAFSYLSPEEIKGKRIILLDDIFDSGATMKEIGKMLTAMGAETIVPVAIAKTVGGDI
jgi:ATP-dependent DNA helicase RecQ